MAGDAAATWWEVGGSGLGLLFSRAHGKGERRRAGNRSGTPNEEKVNKRMRWDPVKGWWYPDPHTGKPHYVPGYDPTPEQRRKFNLPPLAKATAVAAGAAATGWTFVQIRELGGGIALALP